MGGGGWGGTGKGHEGWLDSWLDWVSVICPMLSINSHSEQVGRRRLEVGPCEVFKDDPDASVRSHDKSPASQGEMSKMTLFACEWVSNYGGFCVSTHSRDCHSTYLYGPRHTWLTVACRPNAQLQVAPLESELLLSRVPVDLVIITFKYFSY